MESRESTRVRFVAAMGRGLILQPFHLKADLPDMAWNAVWVRFRISSWVRQSLMPPRPTFDLP
jgi:hypothetical protein